RRRPPPRRLRDESADRGLGGTVERRRAEPRVLLGLAARVLRSRLVRPRRLGHPGLRRRLGAGRPVQRQRLTHVLDDAGEGAAVPPPVTGLGRRTASQALLVADQERRQLTYGLAAHA